MRVRKSRQKPKASFLHATRKYGLDLGWVFPPQIIQSGEIKPFTGMLSCFLSTVTRSKCLCVWTPSVVIAFCIGVPCICILDADDFNTPYFKHSTVVEITSAGMLSTISTLDFSRDGMKYLLGKGACGLVGMRNATLGKK